MRAVDLIGCGALNLDVIYRLPRSFPLRGELGPPGTEQVMDAALRARVDAALADADPVRAGGGQAANTVNALARLGYATAMIGRVGADIAARGAKRRLDSPCVITASFFAIQPAQFSTSRPPWLCATQCFMPEQLC